TKEESQRESPSADPGIKEESPLKGEVGSAGSQDPKKSVPKPEDQKRKGDSTRIPASRSKFLKRLSLQFSVGPDVSAAGLGQPGKITLLKGVSLSYEVGKRYFIRSGFLVASKIYTVGPGGYGSSQYNPGNNYLQSINSNCKVYEIPLTAGYYLNKSENHSWFLSMGLSTYLMKKESYEYFYKYPTGVTTTKYYAVTNQNHHYFSIVDLSGGYVHQFTKRVGVVIEPYVKIPVTGIGVQRIKLNSAGILFSLKWNGL
ncbi:MAG: hypothetical protein KGM98_11165, partial [Bacteroidota bacterium]|nr:hypothetical protein [Bacteroidota bacterium]